MRATTTHKKIAPEPACVFHNHKGEKLNFFFHRQNNFKTTVSFAEYHLGCKLFVYILTNDIMQLKEREREKYTHLHTIFVCSATSFHFQGHKKFINFLLTTYICASNNILVYTFFIQSFQMNYIEWHN